MRRTLLLVFLSCIVQSAISQNVNVLIRGKIDIAQEGDIIQYSKPIQRYFNVFFVDDNENCTVKKNSFSKELQVAKNSFIRLQSKGLPKFVCYVDTDGEIGFEVVTDSISKKQKVIFYGNNAKANELFVNRKLLNDGGESYKLISSIINNSKNHIQALDSLDKVLAPYNNLLKNIHAENGISENCLYDFIAETEQRLLFWTTNPISEGFKNPRKTKMNEDELLKLTKQLLIKYDPFSEKYISSTVVANTAAFKCNLIKEGKVKPTDAKYEKIWAEYKNYFSAVDGQFADYGYAPFKVQEFLIGNAIMTAMAFKVMTDEDFLKVFKSYQAKFPYSSYNSVIMESLFKNFSSSKKVEETTNQFLELDIQGRFVKYEVGEYKDISELIKENFADKMVFVDYWASYCTPCIYEFKHKDRLAKFLKENNIEIVYVSLDNEGSVENWKKFIKNYKLYGYHFLTNKATKDLLNTQFSSIPRYMIYNRKGDLVEDNAFRPSSYEKLINQLKELL